MSETGGDDGESRVVVSRENLTQLTSIRTIPSPQTTYIQSRWGGCRGKGWTERCRHLEISSKYVYFMKLHGFFFFIPKISVRTLNLFLIPILTTRDLGLTDRKGGVSLSVKTRVTGRITSYTRVLTSSD